MKVDVKIERHMRIDKRTKSREVKNIIRSNMRAIGRVFLDWLRLAMHKRTGAAAKYTDLGVSSSRTSYWLKFSGKRVRVPLDKREKMEREIRALQEKHKLSKGKARILYRSKGKEYKDWQGQFVVDYWYMAVQYGDVMHRMIEYWQTRAKEFIEKTWGMEAFTKMYFWQNRDGRKYVQKNFSLPVEIYVPKYWGDINTKERVLKFLRKKDFMMKARELSYKAMRAGDKEALLAFRSFSRMKRSKKSHYFFRGD